MKFPTNCITLKLNIDKFLIPTILFVVIGILSSFSGFSQRLEKPALPEKYYWELCYLQKDVQLSMAAEEQVLLELQQVHPSEFSVQNGQAILIQPGLCAVAFHSKSEKVEFQKMKRTLSFSELRRNIEIIDKRLAITAK